MEQLDKDKEKSEPVKQVEKGGREKARNELIKRIEKEIGQGLISRLVHEKDAKKIDVIPTGSLALDLALGTGGYPKGRIIEVYGNPSSGKSLLSLLAIAQAQKLGELCALVDAEHAFDPSWAKALGVDITKLDVVTFDNGEQALDLINAMVRSGVYGIIVLDSVAGLVPKAEIEGDMSTLRIAGIARMLSQGLRVLTQFIDKTQTIFICINQLRETIGNNWGPTSTTPGGLALKFYASIRIKVGIKSGSQVKDKSTNKVYGHVINTEVVKNKCSAPKGTAEIAVDYRYGVDPYREACVVGVKMGIIKQAGASFQFKELKTQGAAKFLEAIKKDPVMYEEIRKEIKDKPLDPCETDSIINEEKEVKTDEEERPNDPDAQIQPK